MDACGAVRRGCGAVVEAAVLMLGAGDDAELIEDTVIALILVAFGAAAADEGGCGVGIGRVIVAVDVGDRDRPAVAEPADIRVDPGIAVEFLRRRTIDRKSTRLNSSH